MLKMKRNMLILLVIIAAGTHFFFIILFFIAQLEPSHSTKLTKGPAKAIIEPIQGLLFSKAMHAASVLKQPQLT